MYQGMPKQRRRAPTIDELPSLHSVSGFRHGTAMLITQMLYLSGN